MLFGNKMEKFAHKKSLGQHFLNSDLVPEKMCDAADIKAGETVLEIGPGTGVLTRELLARSTRVVALEADRRAITALEKDFSEAIACGQLTIYHHDARKIRPSEFGLKDQGYKVVANIPYYLSGFLFRSLLDTDCQPSSLVFLVQKEVAERIARSKKESLLSISVKVFGDPKYITTVKRGHFTPPPKVDSAVVAVFAISKNRLPIGSEDFFKILKLGFGQKRKQLLGNLSQIYSRTDLERVFASMGLNLAIRAEDLSLEEWVSLVAKLSTIKPQGLTNKLYTT